MYWPISELFTSLISLFVTALNISCWSGLIYSTYMDSNIVIYMSTFTASFGTYVHLLLENLQIIELIPVVNIRVLSERKFPTAAVSCFT